MFFNNLFRNSGELSLISIFDNRKKNFIDYSCNDRVSDVKRKLAQHIHCYINPNLLDRNECVELIFSLHQKLDHYKNNQ